MESVGGVISSNSCGSCIGMWHRPKSEIYDPNVPNSIVTSFNRNIAKRNDRNPLTNAFVTSPETATVLAFAGKLDFNPTTDTIKKDDGIDFKFKAPSGNYLLPKGFDAGLDGYQVPAEDGSDFRLEIDPNGDRLQILDPFELCCGDDIDDAVVVINGLFCICINYICCEI